MVMRIRHPDHEIYGLRQKVEKESQTVVGWGWYPGPSNCVIEVQTTRAHVTRTTLVVVVRKRERQVNVGSGGVAVEVVVKGRGR